jgi:hypothetical protein
MFNWLFTIFCVMPSNLKAMEIFNAEHSRQILDNLSKDELYSICIDIRFKAEQGENVLHICKSIKSKTKKELIERGFRVIEHSSISIQKEGLYYSVYWA